MICFDVHGCVRIDRVPLRLKMCGPALEIDRWRCYVLNVYAEKLLYAL